MIDKGQPLPVSTQARLLGLSRSSVYYEPVGPSESDIALMAAMDEIHMELPFYGIRRIRDELLARGFDVGRQHVATLMRTMGCRLSIPSAGSLSRPRPHGLPLPPAGDGHHRGRAGVVFGRDLSADGPGLLLPHAIMDWASRRVLSFQVSNTLDASFYIEVLEEALDRYGAPEIFNSDQGAQFTSAGFTGLLLSRGVKISMDGRGRWMDNVFIERL